MHPLPEPMLRALMAATGGFVGLVGAIKDGCSWTHGRVLLCVQTTPAASPRDMLRDPTQLGIDWVAQSPVVVAMASRLDFTAGQHLRGQAMEC